MWMPSKYMLDNQNKENNPINVAANRKPKGRHIYIVPLTAVALALLVVTAKVKANNITPYEADLNKDEIVNFQDVAELANDWQQTGQGLEGDLNKDGVVNTADLGAQVAHWLGTWTPIRTVQDLNDIRNDLTGCYALVQDVNASETSTWNEGKGFEPLGRWDPIYPTQFTGSFFGGGHSIIDLYINRPSERNIGLFGTLNLGAIISNLRLENVYIFGKNSAGALAGIVKDAIITKISSSGTVKVDDDEAGGIVGKIYKGTITDSSFDGDVTGSTTIGGLIGGGYSYDPNDILIARCYSRGNLGSNITYIIGGLAGRVSFLTITDSYSTSNVNGDTTLGGLVGKASEGTQIVNSYSTGEVTGYGIIGGLVGSAKNSSITNSYTISNVNGEELIGGLLGYNFGNTQIADSYFTDTSHDNGYGEPVADSNSFHGNSHPVYSTWDFNDVWLADPNNFPTLRQPEEPLEELTEGYQVWDDNDIDKHSNNAPTQMILYQDKTLKELKDLVEITKALARKQADKAIKQVLSKPMQYS